MNGKHKIKEFGDYQTPIFFAEDICRYLKEEIKLNPRVIIEPTCGTGNFILACQKNFESVEKIYGIEISYEYCNSILKTIDDERVTIIHANFFDYNLNKLIDNKNNNILIIGNPPWATNAELHNNLPVKNNFKNYNGWDALTGASNFDISEYIILKLISVFQNSETTIAMLCKTTVARNIFSELNRNNVKYEDIKILNIDAKKIFNVNTSACLFVVKLTKKNISYNFCYISDFYSPNVIKDKIIYKNGMIINAREEILDLFGDCQFEWRQGIKHDCSNIMELKLIENNIYQNKREEQIQLESSLIYPLLKSKDLKQPIINKNFDQFVLVTQKKSMEDTSYIEKIAPKTWYYLKNNETFFIKRKSSIYKNAPPFSMFGIGEYSYSHYKVGISGFCKKPFFSLIYNMHEMNRSVMLDDTSYFLAFKEYDMAYITMLILNCKTVQDFILSISFQDAKRPITKKVLQRIDIKKSLDYITINDLLNVEKRLGLNKYVSKDILDNYKIIISKLTNKVI